MVKKPGLGRGLDILLSSPNTQKSNANNDSNFRQLAIDKIHKGSYQPRVRFDPESLQDLADSIKAQGLIQPIVVRRTEGGKFELVAGERRWRAAQIAGLREIPAVVREIEDQTAAAMALIENIQREDLNPLEEAGAMQRLINDFGLTHQQTADSVGRSRSAVTNILRLLDLEQTTKDLLDENKLDMGHARALLGLEGEVQVQIASKIADKQLTVREAERMVRILNNPVEKKPKVTKKAPEVEGLEKSLADKIGAKVDIQYNNKGKGKLVIEYNTLDELDGILEHLK